jgi:signal transduction histidine kinase/CheY-like chemotaxis protein
MSYTSVTDAMPELLGPKRVLVSKVANMANKDDIISQVEANTTTYYIKDFIRKGDNASEPFSFIIFPIIEDAGEYVSLVDDVEVDAEGNHTVVGITLMMFFWRDLIRNILLPTKNDSNGIVCVFENPCNQTFSYEVNGPNVTYLGQGDQHDPEFDELNITIGFHELAERSSSGLQYTGLPLGGEACPYTLRVYPSASREGYFMTKDPITFTMSAILIFVFTSGVFLIYDVCVERRQRKILFAAVQSSANVSLLERMVGERTRKLEDTNMRLEEANRRVTRASAAQLEHFACMSHEIRTPLNCIIGLSSLLLDTELAPMQEESMRMIVTSGDLLLTVVNDVLDYSKLESGNVEINVVRSNLQDTLNVVIQSMETKAKPKRLSLRTVYDPAIGEFVHIDYRRLQQILFNLLGNAVKFSFEGGTIDLTVSLVTRPTVAALANDGKALTSLDVTKRPSIDSKEVTSRLLRFVVKDCGNGIEKKDFETIFQPFRQASAETERVYGGTGLGLAVTSKLIKSLGGSVSVDSELGKWSAFTVDLPFRDTPVDIQQLARRLKDTRILFVEDDETNVNEMSRVFRQCSVDFLNFKSMMEIVSAVTREGFLSGNQFFVCLAHERLCDLAAFQILADNAPAILLTHGPKYAIKESKGHYRSLTNVLPSVLVESLAMFVEAQAQVPGPATRRPTVKFTTDSAPGNLKILIAEDNKINQKVLLRILKRLHFEDVDIVDNGQLACDAELEKEYDVILMDIQMPVMDGIEACKVITRRTSNHAKPKIVFVTAHVSDAFEAECRAAGGADFLPKPFNIGDIENCLRRNTQQLTYGSQEFASQEFAPSP